MRIGGVVTVQNVSLAALRRPGVYCVCGKGLRDTRSGVRGPGSGVGGESRSCSGSLAGRCLVTGVAPCTFQGHWKAAEKGSSPGVFIFPV